ncbi:MAG: histidinol dehydrogenase [Clostridia bacterium]|nr:histidinol dehydrogenase [Clostridia bacterium]
MKIIKANSKEEFIELDRIKNRGKTENTVELAVKNIIDDVKLRGDKALFDYAEKFDKAKINNLKVSQKEIDEAFERTPKKLIKALKNAYKNIFDFHSKQIKSEYKIINENGGITGRKIVPLNRVGIYVPGGTAAYPSSVLMNAIPAIVAKVSEIVMVTPCNEKGKIEDNILAAAKICNITEIYKSGGAGAIAALAYSTETIKSVDKITGPGNIFVSTAKTLVSGDVATDMPAGPSEILIIADSTANPKFLAADLLSQAEHDILASSILISTDSEISKKTISYVNEMTEKADRKDIINQSIANYGLIINIDSIEKAIELSNYFAPEHLEICTKKSEKYLDKITSAGSVFLGHWTPESVGDYYCGTNHILPTAGTAKFCSGLSTEDFVKHITFTQYNREALRASAKDIQIIAESERLQAHANAVKVRIEDEI